MLFFFNDNTMHKIYEDQGKFNFIYQLPQIIYSTLISTVLNILLQFLALSEGKILDFKKNKKTKELKQKETKLINLLNTNFLLYFILSSVILLGFWYYISMFCAIYKNNLLPGIFRIPSLSNKKNKRNFLFNISKIFQLI